MEKELCSAWLQKRFDEVAGSLRDKPRLTSWVAKLLGSSRGSSLRVKSWAAFWGLEPRFHPISSHFIHFQASVLRFLEVKGQCTGARLPLLQAQLQGPLSRLCFRSSLREDAAKEMSPSNLQQLRELERRKGGAWFSSIFEQQRLLKQFVAPKVVPKEPKAPGFMWITELG